LVRQAREGGGGGNGFSIVALRMVLTFRHLHGSFLLGLFLPPRIRRATTCILHASHSPTNHSSLPSSPSLPPAHAPLSPPLQVTRDHKPDDEVERARVVAAGGSVQQKTRMLPGCLCIAPPREVPIGPHRVVPGGLAVARSMGDVLLKYVLPACSLFILVVAYRFNYILTISVSFISGRDSSSPGFPTALF
jgi:hypothetical protein